MKAPAPLTPEIVDVKRLDHLPLVGAMRRELAVKDTLDALIPAHDRHVVSVGECVEALVLTILTGQHALSRVADTLAGYDLAVIVQRPIDTAHFHDNRLGRALDALWTAGVDRVYGAVITQAIRQYALGLTRLHTDATSLKVYGAYARDEHEEGPVVTYGYSRDHRPDLKQLLFGLTVTAEGVPVWGHITDGNQSDSTEHSEHKNIRSAIRLSNRSCREVSVSGPSACVHRALDRRHDRRPPSRGRSVTNICAGSWVIMRSTRALTATACGVTPQPQKTGTSFARMGTGSP
jgi:hypothetical protein